MQIFVHPVKEIIYAAIDNHRKRFRLYQVKHIDDCILFPVLRIFCIYSDPFRHIPIIRKWPDIYSPTHTPYRPKNILMFKSEIQSSMPSHAKPGNPATRSALYCFVFAIYPLNQFLRYISLKLIGLVDRAIPIPATMTAIWADNNQAV